MRQAVRLSDRAPASALWGKGSSGGGASKIRNRSLARVTTLAAICALAVVPSAVAVGETHTLIAQDLLSEAQANPSATFRVIVQGEGGRGNDRLARSIAEAVVKADHALNEAAKLADQAAEEAQRAERAAEDANRRAVEAEEAAKLAESAAEDAERAAGRGRTKLLEKRAERAQRAASAADAAAKEADRGAADAREKANQDKGTAEALSSKVQRERERLLREQVTEQFTAINGVVAVIRGSDVVELAHQSGILAITRDEVIGGTDPGASGEALVPKNVWRSAVRVDELGASGSAPAIAVIDSGVDASRAEDFGARVVASVNLSSLTPNATGDDQGHGTMVAGVAAGSAAFAPGMSPTASIVSVRTTDGQGRSLTSDLIRGIGWVLENHERYGIRVVNISTVGTSETSIGSDPVARAVERLWLSGLVVVVAAGNHGGGSAVKIAAPANDPFVITVGALDDRGTIDLGDDARAPWSAFGSTADGFAKPELSAPGRRLVMPVPAGASIPLLKPERVVAPGYMWMSGTSFAAPVVAGAAAELLARHPSWTPNQVKGALMLTARSIPGAGASAGVGGIDVAAAAALSDPPNPNENLYAYVADGTFDAEKWASAVKLTPNWTTANWTSANWTGANWTEANWTSANWTAANWTAANWTAANWTVANWTASNWVE